MFKPDQRFESLTEAFAFILDRYVLRSGPERHWLTTNTGLAIPKQMPQYLFRGESGSFPTTTSALQRSITYTFNNGVRLSTEDRQTLQQLIPILANRFMKDDYNLDEDAAFGLLQHYGIPTPMIDFTANLQSAFVFAAAETNIIGRVAVLPIRFAATHSLIVDLTDHQWAVRPQRQAAFGIIPDQQLVDLKAEGARTLLHISWYEFPISTADHSYLANRHQELIRFSDDPSAGFLRFHLTEYVEARHKFSPNFTDWLLERIPIAPRCYLVKEFDNSEVVVNYRGADALPRFDIPIEAGKSRRYWSTAYADKSWERMTTWKWPPTGSIIADSRTYHPDEYI